MRAWLTAGLLGMIAACAGAQVGVKTVVSGDVTGVMLSDLHFDPFHDAAKVARLDAAPVSEWESILREPDSAGQAEGFAAMQKACAAKAPDPDYALLNSALRAAAKQAGSAKDGGAKFVTVSGDLQVHQFACRYEMATKKKDSMEFAAKTASYAMEKVQAEFPGATVYVTLGNNDTGCGDYALDVNDKYFAQTSAAMLRGLRGVSEAEKTQAKADWEAGGYYAVSMTGAMKKTRLVVIDDMYLSSRYQTCGGRKKDGAGEAVVLAWMGKQLDAARQSGETVWVLGHIPPGTDVYSTVKHGFAMCTKAPEMFLADGALGELLTKNGDVIRLAIFGHTHSDEFREFGTVPMKGVGSITAVNGNMPSFTVAKVEGAVLKDYSVYVGSNATGLGTTWAREYAFDETFHAKEFSGAALEEVIARLQKDTNGSTPESMAYERDFFPGGTSPLGIIWPLYACALKDAPGTEILGCMCPKQ